ncbi:STAS/SEC14 domain-containing protein, partial [bacterium]|nr:STAS/SEC14 domain-containing protein [bacterium]
LNEKEGIAILEPHGSLSAEDFTSAARIIDTYIEKSGDLNGIIVHVKSFPGWDSFFALVSHLKFIKEHHKHVSHIAMATDSPLGKFGENIASHFVKAEIKHFSFDELQTAIAWIKE